MKIRSKISPGIVLPGVLAIGSITGIMAIAVISTITNNSTNNASALTYSTDTDVSFTFNPTLSISLSDTNINIDNLLPGLSSESSPITVSVNSNTPYGYSLFASVGNSTDYNTTSLVHSNNDNNNNNDSNNSNNDNSIPATFTSIATNASLPQLDTDNTWGYSFSKDSGTTWSNYNGLPLYSTVDNNTSTNNPALLIDTKSPADSTESIDFKIAAKASTTQASGTYNNVINFYAVGKPAPLTLYEEVAKMNKGTQTLADLQAEITYPTSTDYHEDTSNSGVYEYNSAVFGESSDASNANKIYYYRGVLEPEIDQGEYGSDGKATTYPNYVRLSNNTCWRIVRTTGSGGVKMVYNGTWTGSTCANIAESAQIGASVFNGTSDSVRQAVRIGYTYNSSYASNSTTNMTFATLYGTNVNDGNTASSDIKTNIETWYVSSLYAYTNVLEPSAGYCGDRTMYNSSNILMPESTQTPQYYKWNIIGYESGAYVRNSTTAQHPSLTCANYSNETITVNRNKVDLYTVSGSSSGNKKLSYPIALLTADEASFAGKNYSYLRSGLKFWLLSPYERANNAAAFVYVMQGHGGLWYSVSSDSSGMRPAISLKPGTIVASGTGIATDPWIINE